METITKQKEKSTDVMPSKGLTLKINPVKKDYKPEDLKVYVVLISKTSISMRAYDVLKVTNGKTRYNAHKNELIQSKRYVLKEPPFNVDVFEDENYSERHIMENNSWQGSFFSYFNKDEALDRLTREKEKRILKELVV